MSGGTSGGASTAALAYVGGTNLFYGIRVDSSSNVSAVSGSPYSLVGNNLTFATAGNLLFVASASGDFKSGSIITYRADDNGALTQLSTTALKSSGGADIAVDSTGKFLYGTAEAVAPGQSGSSPALVGFSIDQNSGKIADLPGSPYFLDGGMSTASKPLVTANGAWMCLAMELARTNQGARCYTRHADGSVDGKNFVAPAASTTGVNDLVASIDSTMLFFTDGEQNQVISTTISNTGSVRTYPSGGSFSNGIARSPVGHWVVVSNRESDNLSVLEAGVGGLVPTGNTAKTGTNPNRVVFSRSGTYLFVTSASGTVVYSQDTSTGVLTPLNLSNPAPGKDGGIATM